MASPNACDPTASSNLSENDNRLSRTSSFAKATPPPTFENKPSKVRTETKQVFKVLMIFKKIIHFRLCLHSLEHVRERASVILPSRAAYTHAAGQLLVCYRTVGVTRVGCTLPKRAANAGPAGELD